VAVIAVESDLSEDEVMGFIVSKPNETLTPEEIIDYCRETLAEFKVPRYIQFRDSLPKTATERVAKYLLKKEKGLVSEAHDMETYLKELRSRS
jgi:crotonobetaine/carnitine-CoA ligase